MHKTDSIPQLFDVKRKDWNRPCVCPEVIAFISFAHYFIGLRQALALALKPFELIHHSLHSPWQFIGNLCF